MMSNSLHTKLIFLLQLSFFLYINTFHVKESTVFGRLTWRRNSLLHTVTDGEDLDLKEEVADDIIPSVLRRAFSTSVQPVEDIATLDVDDPSFANVVWPSERDERSKAIANHLLWRREQTNDARKLK